MLKSADNATAEASAAEIDEAATATSETVGGCLASSADAVGIDMAASNARSARKPPFPGVLKEGSAPASVLPATVASGMGKRGGLVGFPDGLGANGDECAVPVVSRFLFLVALELGGGELGGGDLPSSGELSAFAFAFLVLRRGGGVVADFMVSMNSLVRGCK